jgi:hypothetical protein
MTDWEAYRIATFESSSSRDAATISQEGALPVQRREGPDLTRPMSSRTVLDRVARRWLDAGACIICDTPSCRDVLQECRPAAEMHAQQAYAQERRRRAALLASLEQLARGLASRPGRKSVMVFSESFLRDQTIEAALRGVLEAAQHALVSIYFVSAQGLTGPRAAGAAERGPVLPGDVGLMSVEDNLAMFAAAEQLAEETGGRLVTTSNDLGSGLERMTVDSSAYYLLGYQPEKPPDGKWHRLEVKVSRPGLEVRARRRYLASTTPAAPAPDARAKRPAAPALAAGTDRGELPLRVAAYVQDPDELRGLARVTVAVEIDPREVRTEPAAPGSGERRASLDLTIHAVPLMQPPPAAPQVDQRLDLTVGAAEPASWLAVRELALAPGVVQVRAFVRDRASGRIGLATRRLEVPGLSAPYLGTPVLSDRLVPPRRPGEPPALAPVARRAFTTGGKLYCQFEVFNYGGMRLPGLAQLLAGYTLRGPDGSVVRSAAPTPIDTISDRAVRRVELPLTELGPGEYLLQVAVEDRLAGRTLTASEPFRVE